MNAYEQLRRTDDLPAARPDPRFAAHLRTQVEAALAPTIELPEREAHVMSDTIASNTATSSTGTSDTSTAPANAQVLVPYLAVSRRRRRARLVHHRARWHRDGSLRRRRRSDRPRRDDHPRRPDHAVRRLPGDRRGRGRQLRRFVVCAAPRGRRHRRRPRIGGRARWRGGARPGRPAPWVTHVDRRRPVRPPLDVQPDHRHAQRRRDRGVDDRLQSGRGGGRRRWHRRWGAGPPDPARLLHDPHARHRPRR